MRSRIRKHKENICQLGQKHSKTTQRTRRKQAMEIAATKRASMDTHNLLTTNTTPEQTMNDHISAAHFNAMTKPLDKLFDETPENRPAFEHHLLTEAGNPTRSWNQDITNYQPNENSEPFKFLER
jgi:hypothetical protein